MSLSPSTVFGSSEWESRQRDHESGADPELQNKKFATYDLGHVHDICTHSHAHNYANSYIEYCKFIDRQTQDMICSVQHLACYGH